MSPPSEHREGRRSLGLGSGSDGGWAEAGPGGQSRWLPRSRAGAVAAILALIVMVGFWIWAFSPLAPRGHPDALENRTWALGAAATCTRAVETLYLLPGAAQATDPADRGRQIAEATDLLEDMVTELRSSVGELIGSDAVLVDAWLTDWETYLEDRRAYAETLRGGSDPPFTLTARDGQAVTEYMDAFATANDIADCATPDDV